MREPDALLEVEDLRTYFETEDGLALAVDGISFQLAPRETLGLVGESGCGKSVTALSILRLIPMPPGRHAGGRIRLRGNDILRANPKELRRIRGNDVAMIFQEPTTALNPVFTIGSQISEAVRMHQGLDRDGARARAVEMLDRVGIPSPKERVNAYPHQLSGGMRQRAMIAMAMSCDPAVLIADEPTTALDVTVQAQVLDLMRELQREKGTGILLITHDLGVIAENADRVCVMYAGKIVEERGVIALFERPLHPYSVGLMRSLPHLARAGEPLFTIPGSVPSAHRFPSGCRFRTRCPLARDRCATETPSLRSVEGTTGRVACHFAEEVETP